MERANSKFTILLCRDAELEARRRGGSTNRLNGMSGRVDPTKPARFASGRSHNRIVNFDLGPPAQAECKADQVDR